MKTIRLTLVLLVINFNLFAQCYSKIVSYQRNYIALQIDGTLWAKGTQSNGGILGFGNINSVENFTQIGTDSDWTENVSLCSNMCFAIKTNGTLWVWGSNYSNGAAGLGTYESLGIFTPRQVGTDTNWAKIATSGGHTIAVKTDGTLWVWGSNSSGRLGIGNLDDLYKVNIPMQVGDQTDWQKVFTGDFNSVSYAIKSNGTLWSWGANGVNIGYTNASLNNNYRSPHQIGTDLWQTIAVSETGRMTDGIKADGSLWGWGSSNFQSYFFGNGIDIFISDIPTRIGNDSDWKDICIGQSTTIALKNNNTRWGWGRNGDGHQLGMGEGFISNIAVPTLLDSDTDWKSISIDLFSDYGDGIKQNNALYHWGNNHLNIVSPSPTLFSRSTCTLAAENFSLENNISAYPNPVNDVVTVHFTRNITNCMQIDITNSLGQNLISTKLEIVNNELTINMSSYANGLYCITLKNQELYYKTKIIKI